jgi:hypothetical protein
MELVGVGRAGAMVRAADDRFAVGVTQEVGAAVRKGGLKILPHLGPPSKGEGVDFTQPVYILVPGAGFEEQFLFGNV